ncbi:MAG: methyltransferase domain-containing protein [Lachnospiraceae bacterium]|nr:methyltransferase domain-containing protein [Lachnospiraceae bacterium]
MNQTIDYYNKNAADFIETTRHADMHEAQDRFLALLPAGASVLDFGCGSGRDTKYFLDKGFTVTATDGSEELCRAASIFTGIEVKCMLFQDLDESNGYDGIWACSSILHLKKTELLPVIRKMNTALKKNGVIYTSFKYGEFEGERGGRYFTDFTEAAFRKFLAGIPGLVIEKCWITGDVRPGRDTEKWLNVLIRKCIVF